MCVAITKSLGNSCSSFFVVVLVFCRRHLFDWIPVPFTVDIVVFGYSLCAIPLFHNIQFSSHSYPFWISKYRVRPLQLTAVYECSILPFQRDFIYFDTNFNCMHGNYGLIRPPPSVSINKIARFSPKKREPTDEEKKELNVHESPRTILNVVLRISE